MMQINLKKYPCCFLFSVSLLLGACNLEAQLNEPEAVPKDHHFFVGVNLDVSHEGELYPTVGLLGNELLIAVDGDTVGKSINDIGNFRYRKEAKLSNNSVYIDNIQCEEAYSAAADPQWQAASTNLMLSTISDQSTDRVMKATIDAQGAVDNLDRVMNGTGGPGHGYAVAQAQYDANASAQYLSSVSSSAGVNPDSLKGSKDVQKDVLDVSFDISSDKYVEDPYLLMIASLKETQEGEAKYSWLHIRPLQDLRPNRLEQVKFSAGSFPDGMFLGKYEMFIFSGAVEIPSNLSSKRVDMTKDEAHVFMNYQYMVAHAGMTIDPKPIQGTLSRKIMEFNDADFSDRKIRVQVDEEGNVVGCKLDGKSSNSSELDKVYDLLKSAMYFPAMKDGNPVAGEYVFVLSKAAAELGDFTSKLGEKAG